eukprot:6192941-Pleurochrysis_carterae.AAC.1
MAVLNFARSFLLHASRVGDSRSASPCRSPALPVPRQASSLISSLVFFAPACFLRRCTLEPLLAFDVRGSHACSVAKCLTGFGIELDLLVS